MTVTVVSYGASNIASIPNVYKRLGSEAVVTSDPEVVCRADRVVIPGVGAFDSAMRHLAATGLVEALGAAAKAGTPILGLCLGMQLLADSSEEGDLPGLGWIKGAVRRLRPSTDLPVPHVGWNSLALERPHALFERLDSDARFYFAHSYHFVCASSANAIGSTTYGEDFTSVVQLDNVVGIQFHPEKSHRHGLAILERFLSWP